MHLRRLQLRGALAAPPGCNPAGEIRWSRGRKKPSETPQSYSQRSWHLALARLQSSCWCYYSSLFDCNTQQVEVSLLTGAIPHRRKRRERGSRWTTMSMIDQDLAEVAKHQIATRSATYIEKICPHCKARRMVHDFQRSEDWCVVCGHSEAWGEEQ